MNLDELLKRHTKILAEAKKVTIEMYDASVLNDEATVMRLSDNRQRIIHVLNNLHDKITNIPNFKKIINIDWKKNLVAELDQIKLLNEKIITNLQKQMVNTREEIAEVFKTKQGHKGYNLNDLRPRF